MVLNSTQQMGKLIGNTVKQQDSVKENIAPEEVLPQEQIYNNEFMNHLESGVVNQATYPTDSFIIDHPIYGDIDSSVLRIDGGYQCRSFITGAWNLNDANIGEGFQFEREGYFCPDSVKTPDGRPIFNRTITLRDTWAKIQAK